MVRERSLRRERALLVSGPTASGKSELALRIARELDGEIISVDSVQVYRGLSIGSAKPGSAEQAQVPHHLIDVITPAEQCNVAWFTERAREILAEINSRGRPAIVCGGTGLYVRALVHGLADLPAADPELRRELAQMSTETLYAELMSVDPGLCESIAPSDRVRIERALETWRLSGKRASELRAAHAHQGSGLSVLALIPVWPRDELYRRIDSRAAHMVRGGIIEETERALERFGPKAPGLKTIGYRETCAYLRGALELEDLAPAIAQATRRFAKQQLVFWRNEPRKLGWNVTPAQPAARKRVHGELREIVPERITFAEILDRCRAWLRDEAARNEVRYLSAELLLES